MLKGTERDFNSEFVEGRPNCVGYVLSALGIIDSDRYITPGRLVSYSGLFEKVADVESAEVIAFIEGEDDLFHLTLIEKSNPEFITHRSGPGADIEVARLSSVLRKYQALSFQIISLRRK